MVISKLMNVYRWIDDMILKETYEEDEVRHYDLESFTSMMMVYAL